MRQFRLMCPSKDADAGRVVFARTLPASAEAEDTRMEMLIALAFVAGTFAVTYVTSRICFMANREWQMLGAVMLCAAGVIYPLVITGFCAALYLPSPVVPPLTLAVGVTSLVAHFLALKKSKL